MKTVFDGYSVEESKQVLLSGEWNSDDCEWEWETSYKHFAERDAAERYFRKCKKVLSEDIPIIRLCHCRITYNLGEYTYEEGDPILEMDLTGNGVEVWKW